VAEFGLIGRTLTHSFSKKYFTEKFEKEDLPYRYENFELKEIEQLGEVLDANPELIGFNVTVPYKLQILPFLDKLDLDAQKVGAVNTVKIEQGKLVGYNTDFYGFVHSIRHLLNKRKQALILGTGGASKAVAAGLTHLGLHHRFVSRTPKDGDLSYADASEWLAAFEVVVNTTPVGQYPQVDEMPPLSLEGMTENHLIYDLIYNPPYTRLLQEAKERKGVYKNGLDMLIFQAERAWEIWMNH
jgi:shikimate dehydrogenase